MKGYPNYYSITPATVRYDNRLKANEKLLFGEITALSNIKGYCYSTNKYFSKLYNKDVATISRWISHLKELGYLKIETIRDGKQIKERHLFPVTDPIDKKINTPIDKKVKRGIDEKVKENNTSNNNTSNNNTTTTADNKLENLFEKYQIYVGMLSGTQTPLFSEYVHELGNDVVNYAIDNMLNYTRKPNFNYLRKILDKYESLDIDSVEKAKELDEKHSKKQEQIKQNRNSRYTGRKPIEEKMPYWYQYENKETNTNDSHENIDHAEIEKLMRKINDEEE